MREGGPSDIGRVTSRGNRWGRVEDIVIGDCIVVGGVCCRSLGTVLWVGVWGWVEVGV